MLCFRLLAWCWIWCQWWFKSFCSELNWTEDGFFHRYCLGSTKMTSYFSYYNWRFHSSDISITDHTRFPSHTMVTCFLKIISNGTLKPLRHDTNLRFLELSDVLLYNVLYPHTVNPALTFEAIVLKSNPTPVTIINRCRENYVRMEYRNGMNGIYCMRNETHRNNCNCLFPANSNNCELTFYSNICIPKDLIIE